ncbi:aromatic acid exporter family protein [Bacillus sp. BHET2]|uniref:FUSC family protein n=1 Tax=Bacillus sp. BHET2 TaxID=2583818 RepID=UPI00110E2B2A|nr:aromatic acid exporter family protein [Bacillus sp. BHET2]TMU83623.1 aromatic acid exporter family protein [Bacillus sp. BHET2]
MKLGARILKTGIAIVLALLVSQLLGIPSPVFAGIAAVFAVQPTIYRSYLSIIEQIQANLIGAGIAVLFVLLFGSNPLIVGLAAVIAIAIILKLKLQNTIGLALVTMIAIMEVTDQDFIQFAFIRFSTIMIGVFSSFFVNLIFLPPKYETKLYHKVSDSTEEILKWIRLSTRHATEFHLLKKDLERIKEKLIKVDQLYLLYKEERDYFKKNSIGKSRKLVIFRQMISSTNRSFEILKRLNRYENEIFQLPDELRGVIKNQLDCLLTYHEQLLLKFLGKMHPNAESEAQQDVCLHRKELMKIMLEEVNHHKKDDNIHNFHLLHIFSAIFEYDEHLEHLEKLITSFQSYHKEDNEVMIGEEEE